MRTRVLADDNVASETIMCAGLQNSEARQVERMVTVGNGGVKSQSIGTQAPQREQQSGSSATHHEV